MRLKSAFTAAFLAAVLSGCFDKEEYDEPKKFVLVSQTAASSAAVSSESTAPDVQSKTAHDLNGQTEVYFTPTGKRYHISKSCAGDKALECTLDEALEKGLTPCKKCVK